MDYKEFLRKSMQKNEEEAKQLLLKQQQEKITTLSKGSGIPRKFRNKTLADYNTKNNAVALNKAMDFINNFPNTKGLLLTGKVGTGKTHIAAAIGNELIKKLYSVYFGNVIDVIGFIKSTFDSESDLTEQEAIRLITEKMDLFIIDDLGKENSTEYTLSLLYQLINKLYENEGHIIITTNFNSIELSRKLGERGQAIVSRLVDMCDPIKFEGEDWRLK